MDNITVWLVDGITRLHLPKSSWAQNVIDTLETKNHEVVQTQEAAFPDNRSVQELARRDNLLDETGL